MFHDSFHLLPSNSSSLPLFTYVTCLQGRFIPEKKLSHHAAVILRELNILQELKVQILHTTDEINDTLCPPGGPGSSVGIATGYGLDGPGI